MANKRKKLIRGGILNIFNAKNTYLVSDNHFFHYNIINYCDRVNPETGIKFQTTEEMNELMIKRWNKVVPNDGVVIHGGDFSFRNDKDWKNLLSKLNHKYFILVRGNHTKMSEQELLNCGIDEIYNKYWLDICGVKILFTHKPAITTRMLNEIKISLPNIDYEIRRSYVEVSETAYKSFDINIHGHIHNNKREQLDKTGKHFNISVEMIDYTPITLDNILRRMDLL